MEVSITIDGVRHVLAYNTSCDPCGTCSLNKICNSKDVALCNYFQPQSAYCNFQKVEQEP